METNHNINFNNGSYNLENNLFVQNENSKSSSVGYDYISEYTEHKNDLTKYLEDLVPDELDRKSLLDHISNALCGVDRSNTCLNIYGDGNNGKTTFIKLVEASFGEFCKRFPHEMLTQSLEYNKETLYKLSNIRYIVCDFSGNEQINTAIYKEMLSNDKFYFQNAGYFNLKFEMCIVSNTPITFKDDMGAEKRTKRIKFPKTFEPNFTFFSNVTFESNFTLEKNINLWKNDFMLLLIENYKNNNNINKN